MDEQIKNAMHHLDRSMSARDQYALVPFELFLQIVVARPSVVLRNIFQLFYDMVKTYVEDGIDEYPGDPESINFVYYDCHHLFVEGSDNPFFADRPFANRLINLVESLKHGAQQNKIYIFQGPPGCGKSTFLNNLVMRFEEYTNREEGSSFEVVWRLDRRILDSTKENKIDSLFENWFSPQGSIKQSQSNGADEYQHGPSYIDPNQLLDDDTLPQLKEDFIEIPCPSHDHPILLIPKHIRRQFLDDLLVDGEFKHKLFTDKEYDWIFKNNPCTICSSIYRSLLNKLHSPHKVFQMLYTRLYQFNRRLGEGISVFNPGDRPLRQNILTNAMIQKRINNLLMDSNQVKYIFSRYAKTNNGIYALMDIKANNIERLIDLHNIISEAVHKVEDTEENVNSLFIALMNPEDKINVQDFQSFSDRIEYINIPYVLDINTEVKIYRNIFGKHIDDSFLPRVLHNFARVIVSSRINIKSEAMLEWIERPEKYRLYCDENLQLLKMEIYTGHIPPWLSEEDRKRFTATRRRKIVGESETEGGKGFSGRDSIKIFSEFYSAYAQENKLINMSTLINFFSKNITDYSELIPEGFLDSLIQMYDYNILQQVKESLYYYNADQISIDIQNYLFAVNFEPGSVETCIYTKEELEITEDFFNYIENQLLDPKTERRKRFSFRKDTQKEYATRTLTQEIMVEGKNISETTLYKSLYDRYVYNLKETVLDRFLENENFRRAIKDYDEEAFKTYDKKIKNDVTFLINNLCSKYNYTRQGAKESSIYVIDRDLAKKFANP